MHNDVFITHSFQINYEIRKIRMAENGPSKINLREFIQYFEQHSPVPDFDDQPFILNYKIDDIQGSPSLRTFKENRFDFICLIITKRLLRHTMEAMIIHADTTYKLNWMGYPVHVFGISDHNKKFHLIAIGFSTRETTEVFEFCFREIKRGILELFEEELEISCLMSDAAPAIKNAFEMVFPYAIKLTCWFHVEEAIRKRKMAEVRNKTLILNDLKTLHLSPNLLVFDVASKLFINKWNQENECEFTSL